MILRVIRRLIAACIFVGVLVGTVILLKSGHYDVLQTHGVVAERQRQLLIFTLVLSAVVVLPVFFMLGLFAWKYRSSRPASKKGRYTPEWASNRALEAVWWGIPIAIIAVLAVVAWQTSHELDPYKPIASSREPIEVQVIALEWKWLFIYPDLGIATVNQLPIEVDRPVHFSLTADAPMSAFWIPALGSQIYTMNGMSSQLNLMSTSAGNFMGYTTNINGKGYADMKFVTHSMTAQDFAAWTENAKKSENVMDEGEYVRLAAQSINNKEATYRLASRDLYESVVMKYMKPTAQKHNEDQPPVGGGGTMHTMEGM